MLPNSAPAPAEPHPTPAQAGPRLSHAGGTNPARWPLRVTPAPGEALESWVGRLAYRYGLTPRKTLRLLDVPVAPQRQVQLRTMLNTAGIQTLAEQLHIDPAALAPDPQLTSLEQARQDYLCTFHSPQQHDPRGSRFCPGCLTEGQHWQASWTSPLHAVCTRHGVLLASKCGWCENTPFDSPVWMTNPEPTWACAAFDDGHNTNQRYRQRCDSNLRSAPAAGIATDLELAAQQHILDLAISANEATSDPVPCCGLPTPPGIALEAILDLIHSQLGARYFPTSPAEPVHRLAQAMVLAVHITSLPTPEAARTQLTDHGLVGPQDPQAPLGPTYLIRARPHNRVLETITLLGMRDRFSIDTALKFRVGAPLPCYPAQQRHPNDTRHLHHDQDLPELPMAHIPTLIWPQVLHEAPSEAINGHDPLLVRAATAMALAKTASKRRWHLLATDLGLPANMAAPIRKYFRQLYRQPELWLRYLSWVDTLFVNLHRDPPPIDYQLRRAVAADHGLLTAAARHVLTTSERPRPPEVTPTTLTQAFWEIYTESDLTLAPPPTSALDPTYRRAVRKLTHPATMRPWLDDLQAQLAAGTPVLEGEPLTWIPP